ncbi:uncharacterized protein LOC120528773 [Polypterus senegalus]|uniref:uncharacterized protein LOC120528773 n=1 Tax=Polypterus senegalus TaxID=55291 RepID=UPI0019667A3D|nr:uncharacterized protein LOC120528773 [Polypterus senegalus]
MSVQSYNAAKVTENLYPKSEQSSQMSPNVSFHLPALIMETPHREAILNISASPDNSLLVVGQDGMVTHWSADLILKKSRIVLEENKQPARTPKWIADATFMPQFNKLVIGTCDREIRFYEMANFEPYFQITGLESMPLQIDYSHTGEDECLILYGDNQGCVNIIQIFRTAETLRNWSKYQVMDGIPSIPLENISDGGQVNYIRWKVHNDWVTKLKLFDTAVCVYET